MRLYLPATLALLRDPAGLRPRAAHAVTGALAAALPEEDGEGLELAALLAAADDSVVLLSGDGAAPRRRVVVVAEAPGAVRPTAGADDLPSAVGPPDLVPWSAVVSLHVDEAAAEDDVAAAAAGDDAAGERAAERDLLWYDVTELDVLRSW